MFPQDILKSELGFLHFSHTFHDRLNLALQEHAPDALSMIDSFVQHKIDKEKLELHPYPDPIPQPSLDHFKYSRQLEKRYLSQEHIDTMLHRTPTKIDPGNLVYASTKRFKLPETESTTSQDSTAKITPKHICSACGLSSRFKCPRCRNQPYCSRTCLMSDWNNHKRNCVSVVEQCSKCHRLGSLSDGIVKTVKVELFRVWSTQHKRMTNLCNDCSPVTAAKP